MTFRIHIDRLRIFAFHGVLEQERRIGADFYVSIVAECEVDEVAYRLDDLSGTVSYAEMVDVVKREMAKPSMLLENVAWRIAEGLKQEFGRLKSVVVRIDKQNPPCQASADAIGVELRVDS